MAKIVDVAEIGGAELAGGLAQGDDDGVRGRVVRLADPVVGPGDHRVVDDGDRGDRALAALDRQPRLGQRLAHEQLVVHGPMIQAARRAATSRRTQAGRLGD